MYNKIKAPLFALIACFLWALAFPSVKLLYLDLNVGHNTGAMLTLAGMRFVVGGVIVLVYYGFKEQKMPVIDSLATLSKFSLLGLVQTALLYMFFFNGLSNTTGVKSSILSQSSIFFVMILAHFTLKNDKISLRKSMGLLFGVVGILTVNLGNLNNPSEFLHFTWNGDGFMLCSGFFSALGTILAKKMGQFANPILMNGWQMTLGGIFLLMIGVPMNGGLVAIDSPIAWLHFLMLIFISVGAFNIWYSLLQTYKASTITLYKFTIPIIGSILSALLIPGEYLTGMIVVALILVSIGIIITNTEKGQTHKG